MLSTLHIGLATTTTLFALALAIWGFLRYLQGRGVEGDYLGAVVVGEGLILVQGIIGGLLLGGGERLERLPIHLLYGVLTIITFPAFYAFTRGQDSRREMLLWALISLFVFGLTIRARLVAL